MRCCNNICGHWYHVTCAMFAGAKVRQNNNSGAPFLVNCQGHPHKHDKVSYVQVLVATKRNLERMFWV